MTFGSTSTTEGGTSGDDTQSGSRRRWVVAAGGIVLVLAGVGWIVARGLLAQAHLNAARGQMALLAAEVETGDGGDPAAVSARLRRITRETAAARGLLSDPVSSLAAHVPVAGCPLRSARSLTRAVDDLAAGTLPPLVTAVAPLTPARIWTGETVHLDVLGRLQVPLDRADRDLGSLQQRIHAAPACGPVGRASGLAAARAHLLAQLASARSTVEDAAVTARLAPPMLGADGPRRYLLVVGNDAESRATGGVIGGLGLLTATRGRLKLVKITGNDNLPGGDNQLRPAAPLPAPLISRYGTFGPTTIWGNANLVPDYPTVSRFYSDLYRAGTGTAVDGTVTVDPTALSYLLAATGSAVAVDGQTVTGANLVDLLESHVYASIADPARRDQFFADVGRAAYQALVASGPSAGPGRPRRAVADPVAVIRAVRRAVVEGRLAVGSNHPPEQKALAAQPIGGAMPDAPGPFLAVVTQNAAASKLDYWTRRFTDYRLTRRSDGTADATITVRLTNAAPTGLPAYVRLRMDPGAPPGNPGAQNRLWVSVYTGARSGVEGATLDGKPVALDQGAEFGHPVASTWMTLDRGQTRTLVLRVWEPVWSSVLRVRPQPMSTPDTLRTVGIRPRPATAPAGPTDRYGG